MGRSGDGKVRRTRISDRDVEFYEENIARMNGIINQVRGIMLDVSDPAVLEAISGRLTIIIERAGQTRRALIAHRDARQLGDGQNDGDGQ